MADFIRNYAQEQLERMELEREPEGHMIARMIKEHMPTVERQLIGQRYYTGDHDIMTRLPKRAPDGTVDLDKPDWGIVANFHANQVDHKVGYLLAEPINFKAPSEKEQKAIGDIMDDSFDDMLNDVFTAASNKGIEWVHTFYNEDGELKFEQVPSEQIVPVYDEYGRLSFVIRHYTYLDVKRAEVWTDETVTFYMETNDGYVPDFYWGEEHEQTHFEGGSWGRVPFTPFRNNSQETGDLWKYKELQDAFNRRLSDLQNTFDESTDLIFVLRGYEGTDLREFMNGLRHYKAINVSADPSSGVETLTIRIPVEETKDYLHMLREMITDFGRGVDFQSDKFGNSPSGVALRVLFANLDLKAKQLERKARVAVKDLLWFVYEDKGLQGSYKDVEMTFKYNRLANDLEQSQIAVNSKGIISDETIIAKHPWVDDPQGEQERLLDQLYDTQPLPTVREGDVNGSGDDQTVHQQPNQ